MSETATLGVRAARGAAWSGASTLLLRLGSVIVGIVLARLLTPEQFGVYAIALTVQGVLMTLADLGLSADIIRSRDPDRIAPTVASLGLAAGGALAALTLLTSGDLAALLGAPEAGPAIAILSATLLMAGASVVPYGLLMRRFRQRELFLIALADFVVSTVLTLALVAAGMGVLGLAIGRVAAQAVASALQFALARVRPRYGFDRRVAGAVLAFGLPVAAANMLSWALINVDNVVLARTVGAVALGFYVLAFNIAGWPMSALSSVVRSIALPYFSRGPGGFAAVTSLVWAAALPAGALLAVLAGPLVEVLYGARWLPAAPALAALGVYGGLRVLFDAFAGYLYARGRPGPVMWLQIASLAALTVALVIVAPLGGIVAAAWAHVAVAALLILPGYLVALRAAGARPTAVIRALALPSVASVPCVAVGALVAATVPDPLAALLVGGISAGVCHLVVVGHWLRARIRELREPGPDPSEDIR